MLWLGTDDGRVVLVRQRASADGEVLLLDQPTRMRFGQPIDAECCPGLSLREVVDVAPGWLDSWCGWYAGHGRRFLLTQFADADFGEPMVLIGEGDAVVRAYPVSSDQLVREDGLTLSLIDDGGRALCVGEGGSAVSLGRDDRYRERELEFRVGDHVLAGTLITPATPGPHPTAVMVHGAAGGQRDFCRLLVGPLLDAGVAAFIYDKQGHGRSTGTPEVSIFDQARAAAAALDRLTTEPDVQAGRLGLIGFSNGMWAVPMVAAHRPDVTFVVGVGSPGVSMAESEVHRRTKVLREAGIGQATVDAAGQAWRCIFAIASAGEANEHLVGALSETLDRLHAADDLNLYKVPEYARQNPQLSAIPPVVAVDELVEMVSGTPDAELGYDPAVDYVRLRCPVLLQWGQDDTSVPVPASVRAISAALPSPDVATLRVYPGVEHMLNVTVTDVDGISPEEAMYRFHGFRFSAEARRDLSEWLRILPPIT